MLGLVSQTKIRKDVVHADVDVDKSLGLCCGVFRWSRGRANWPSPLHPKFICHDLNQQAGTMAAKSKGCRFYISFSLPGRQPIKTDEPPLPKAAWLYCARHPQSSSSFGSNPGGTTWKLEQDLRSASLQWMFQVQCGFSPIPASSDYVDPHLPPMTSALNYFSI